MKPIWMNCEAYNTYHDHYEYYGPFGIFCKEWVRIEFTDPNNPPYLIDRNAEQWTWNNNLVSDENSTPGFALIFFPRTLGIPACYPHDQVYNTGKLSWRRDASQPWQEITVNRAKADDIIYDGWIAGGTMHDGKPREGVTERRANLAECTLRTFGWMEWKG